MFILWCKLYMLQSIKISRCLCWSPFIANRRFLNEKSGLCWCGVVYPRLGEYICNKSSAPKAQGPLQKRGQKDFNSQSTKALAVRLYLLGLSEAAPLKSHQHDCLNVSWSVTALDILEWTWKTHEPSDLH